MAIKASVKEQFQTDSLKGIRIALQGLGNVGYHLAEYLVKEGAVLTIADIDQEKVVCGGSNNQHVFVELEGYSPDRALDKTVQFYDSLMEIFAIAKRGGIGRHTAADRMGESRIKQIGKLKQTHLGLSTRQFSTLREVKNR